MRIVIIAPGSRGDVEPYIALGKGLKKAGHDIRFISHVNFAELVNSQGLEFWPVDVDVQGIAQSADMRERLGGGNFLKVMSQMAKEAELAAVESVKVGMLACQGMELILTGVAGLFIGIALAEKLELPLLQAYYIPFTPTRLYPSFLLPQIPIPLGGTLNRLTYQVARQAIWQGFRSADKLVREKELNLPRAPFFGPYDSKVTRDNPILYGFSPSVIPHPTDWADNIHVTGYWFLEPDENWIPPQPLVDFLQAGPAPHLYWIWKYELSKPEETTRLVLSALAATKQRGILQAGWGGLHTEDLPGTVFTVDAVPFSWLFPRMAAVVHHGGAGTTAAGLRAGVPSVVIPFFGDQPYWGSRVADLGVGPAPIPLRKLTVDRLSQAIQTAVSDPAMRQRSTEMGEIIRAEDGVAAVISILQKL